MLRGEFRDPGATGSWTHLFGDIISARPRLKQHNHLAEVNLQRRAEPWAAISAMTGGEYLKPALDRCWKFLLQNHPHDTITGGGIDQMERDSLFRFNQINIIAEGVARRGLERLQIQIDNGDLPATDSVLTVFNPCPFPRKAVISCLVDMPQGMGYTAFTVKTPEGKTLRVQQQEKFPMGVLVRNLQDISVELRTERVRCHVETADIPAFGYSTYHLVRAPRFAYLPGTLAPETNVLENEHLRVVFNSNGTLDLTHKETGRVYAGLHYFEDSGETGHSWVHMAPERDEIITSHGVPCHIALEESGPLFARMRVDYHLQIPVSVEDEPYVDFRQGDINDTGRTQERREMIITSRFTLRAGAKRLDVTTSFENTCKHHRLRVVFPTRLDCDRTDAEIAYDVIGRDIHIKEASPYYGHPNPQYPMHRFVDMTDGTCGFAVINNCGLREYEAMDKDDRPLAITLLRAFTYRNSPVFGRWETYPDMELAQCIGKFEWSYALYPHAGDWTNGCYREAEAMNLPLEPAQAGPHEGTLPKALSFLTLEGENLQITALKQAEDRPGNYILRLFNPTENAVQGALILFKAFKEAWLTNMDEERKEQLQPKGNRLDLNVPKKKILTIEFAL